MSFIFEVLVIAPRLLTAAAWKLHLNPAFWVVLPVQREYQCLTRGPRDPLTSTTTRSWNLLALLGGRKKGCSVIQMALWDNFKTSANSFHPGLICRSYLKMVKCCWGEVHSFFFFFYFSFHISQVTVICCGFLLCGCHFRIFLLLYELRWPPAI